MSNARKRTQVQAEVERQRRRQFGALTAGVLLAAAALIALPVLARGRPAPGAVKVEIDMAGFRPNTINARAGQPLTIALINPDSQFHTDGGGRHNFVIEALGVQQEVQPRSTLNFSFTPEQPGTYPFYCDICCGGKENPSMQGFLVVT